MKKFENKESYKHLFAKELMVKWFTDEEKNNDYCNVAQFNWRSNYGVFPELKFYETSDPYYFECSDGLGDIGQMMDNEIHCLEWFRKDYNRGKILFVPDITVFHKGMPKYLFEIVHTHPVTPKKVNDIYNFFDGHNVELYEISAEQILSKDSSCIPEYLECIQLL